MTELAPMQQKVFDMIHYAIHTHGKAPTYRVMADRLGVAVNAIAGHVAALEKKGYILREDREIRLLRRGS